MKKNPNTIFLVSNQASSLEEALQKFTSTATVEAEYGEKTVMGSVATLAHHGANAGQPCPCSYKNGFVQGIIEAVGLSHIDLDSLGGCAAVLGTKPEASDFWELAEFVDLNGPHKIGFAGATPENIARIHAWWAWSKQNRFTLPQSGEVADATEYVTSAIEVITKILQGDQNLLAEGEVFRKNEQQLNIDSFVEEKGGVILRVSRGNEFCNSLYTTPDGVLTKAVIVFKTATGGCTLSFADPSLQHFSAITHVQTVWGKDAGGHAGIAGNPRGTRATMTQVLALRQLVIENLV